MTLRSVLQLRSILTQRDSSNMPGKKLKTNPRISYLEQRDGTMATAAAAKVEVLTTFFTSVFTQENQERLPVFDKRHCTSGLTHLNITSEDIKQLVLVEVNGSKSTWVKFTSGIHQGSVCSIRTTSFILFYQRHAKCSRISSAFICLIH